MGMRRAAVAVLVAALGLAACAGDSDDAGIAVDDPIGPVEIEAEAEPALESTPSVAKSARVEMEVPRAGVADAAQAVVDLATSPKIDGYLSSSVVDVADGYGTAVVLVHVPAARFEQAVVALSGIGDLTRQEMAGDEVTEPGTTRRERAALAAEVAYAPIDVAIEGRRPAPPPEQTPIEEAVATAADLSLGIASGAIVAAGVVVPVGVIALAIYLTWSFVARRVRLRWGQS